MLIVPSRALPIPSPRQFRQHIQFVRIISKSKRFKPRRRDHDTAPVQMLHHLLLEVATAWLPRSAYRQQIYGRLHKWSRVDRSTSRRTRTSIRQSRAADTKKDVSYNRVSLNGMRRSDGIGNTYIWHVTANAAKLQSAVRHRTNGYSGTCFASYGWRHRGTR